MAGAAAQDPCIVLWGYTAAGVGLPAGCGVGGWQLQHRRLPSWDSGPGGTGGLLFEQAAVTRGTS
jgi:hypothetical protein